MSEQVNMAAHYEHEIPEGYEAKIEDNKVIIELKESEDERIRKYLIDVVNDYCKGSEYEGCIAYLEKQKECFFPNFPKSCGDCPKEIQAAIDKEFGIDGRDDNDNPLNGYGDWKKGMVLNGPAIWGLVKLGTELHKEQKPAEMDNEEIELSDFESELFSAFSDGWQQYLRGEEVNVAQWTKEHSVQLLNAAKKEQQSTEWSEEEKKVLDSIIDDYKKANKSFCGYTGKIMFLEAIRNGEYDLLKQEWSGEEIVNWLKENFYVSSFDNTKIVTKFSSMDDLIKSVRKRLKFLRPHPHWKPSEEQMKGLLKAMTCTQFDYKTVESLYDDLKKLM